MIWTLAKEAPLIQSDSEKGGKEYLLLPIDIDVFLNYFICSIPLKEIVTLQILNGGLKCWDLSLLWLLEEEEKHRIRSIGALLDLVTGKEQLKICEENSCRIKIK